MSAPVLLACSAAALCLGLPVLAASGSLEAKHRAANAADAAALAAADAANGWINSEATPCELAEQVAVASGASVAGCSVDPAGTGVRVLVRTGAPIVAEARAYAAAESSAWNEINPVSDNGWAWPSNARGVTQGFHDGMAIDLAVDGQRTLYAPFDGVVVRAGPDGAGMPEACRSQPSWWRGQNYTVLIRHEYEGRVVYSSHNHIVPTSPEQWGIFPGKKVVAGQPVAQAGMSGCTSGLHTHFTLSSKPVNAYPDLNPYKYLGPP
ncbi:peptidoglycan DD-metalloendopeptidase family protein [Leucobacter viscericola]|uniref:Peptidoglycan DD-metalloendopeptidase family protein n=1 Tax=Leucobacter viscericola TaxID=2714935 RepID=A0A6G7XH79_9MICO|nr:peptidoglycan DD-metalloendopeptidase family protein [Leucobacter viscericola]QIK63960.1 peptidoglycan DD-metalloendopeptidase family protein [Leucobacter viscericola]